jgi:PAS domain S-box-containing protein
MEEFILYCYQCGAKMIQGLLFQIARQWPQSWIKPVFHQLILTIIILTLPAACTAENSVQHSTTLLVTPGNTATAPGGVSSSVDGMSLLFLGNKNIAPVVYLKGNTPSGVAVDIVRAMTKYISQPVEIRVMDWKEAQALVLDGKADALIQINKTEEREKIYDFSEPLLESYFSIFTNSNRMGITGLSSLKGLRVGVEKGGLPQQILEKDSQVILTTLPNFLEGFKMLNAGTIDAVVVDYRVGSYVIAENNLRNIKVSGDPISSSFSFFAVKKGNSQLLHEINLALRSIKEDGTYQKILDSWQPTEVVFQTEEQITAQTYRITIIILLMVCFLAVIWIITNKKELEKRKAAEEKLEKQYLTLSGIINSTNALIFSVDRKYCYTSFNQSHAGMMKLLYGADIKIGHNSLDYIYPEKEQEKVRSNLERALAGEYILEEVNSEEGHQAHQYYQISYNPIKAGENEIIGVTMLAQDISELKARTAELEFANQELASLSYSIAHSLRTPLRALEGFSYILLEEYHQGLDETAKDYLKRIRNASHRMWRVTEDLMELLSITQEKVKLERVDLSRMAEDIIRNAKAANLDREVDFICQGGLCVEADVQMMQVLMEHLLGNAWKFTCDRHPARIEFGSLIYRKKPAFFIRDNGVGFDMAYYDKLFGIFQSLHPNGGFEGTGVGLATVQRIIQRHGGRVWADGMVEQGATFYFTLG